MATGQWFNRPTQLPLLCDGTVEESKDSTFAYWVKVANGPRLPAQTHRALKNALRRGGTLVKTCEVRQGKRALMARVFVEFEKRVPTPSRDYLGIDVGVNAGIARSDGYIGKDLHILLDRIQQKRDEQRRQCHVKSSQRTACKQYLDHEARKVVTLAARSNKILVVESLKTLANLKLRGSIGAWAKQHFAARCLLLAEEQGVTVLQVYPAYTSITCGACGCQNKKNRRGTEFGCQSCGTRGHADILGARNLVRKATGAFPFGECEKAGIQIRDSFSECPPRGGVS